MNLRTLHATALAAIAASAVAILPTVPLVSAAPVGDGGEAAFAAVEPVLANHCYDCHGDGADKGDFSIDDFETVAQHLANFDVWFEVWKNVRSNLMPPADKPQLASEDKEKVLAFIEEHVFRIDRENPDPGRVTIRRLNREEYRWSIKDLLEYDFRVEDVLPADDTGYGFDTIGDVLSISPLLMEKYLEAATLVVDAAVPVDGPQIVEWWLEKKAFRDERSKDWSVGWMPFEHARKMQAQPWIAHDGEFDFRVDFRIKGSDEATSHTATLRIGVDDETLAERKLGWDNSQRITLQTKARFKKGTEQTLWLSTETGSPPQEGESKLAIEVEAIRVRGPLDGSQKDYPWHIRHLFSEGPPPDDEDGRDVYRAAILRQFATKAFRRPIDDETLARLVAISREVCQQPGNSFEDGIAEAITAILVSPRFLLRAEIQPEPDNPGKIVPLDEYALASRLSYFLWSSVPDDELHKLAAEGKLRENLRAQIDRMLADPKSERMVVNFVGQWLQARDVVALSFNLRSILGKDNYDTYNRMFNSRLRQAMRQESELFFAHVLREDRPATELLLADYTFLNEPLAEWYGIDGVSGSHMRKVDLPKDSKRGGILAQATFQIVTSNPTRTSPVKRGLFVLENFLATPPPPAAPDVPALEESAQGPNRNLPLRDLLKLHAEEKMCASCHARMDPIGLALENFNAVGLWRDEEKGHPIDAGGQLLTGESFASARELGKVLATSREEDFLRALAEKMTTFAVGRGIEYFDAPTIDRIVEQAREGGGTLRQILYGVVESAPFQMRRGDGGHGPAIAAGE